MSAKDGHEPTETRLFRQAILVEYLIEALLVFLRKEDIVRFEFVDLLFQAPVEGYARARQLGVLQQRFRVFRLGKEVLVCPEEIRIADHQVCLEELAGLLQHYARRGLAVCALRDGRDWAVVVERCAVLFARYPFERFDDFVVAPDRVPDAEDI